MNKTSITIFLLIITIQNAMSGGVHGKLPITDFEDRGNSSIVPFIIIGIIIYVIISLVNGKKEGN